MKRVTLSPEAARDIREIWAFIAKDSIKAARRVRGMFQAFLADRKDKKPVANFSPCLCASVAKLSLYVQH